MIEKDMMGDYFECSKLTRFEVIMATSLGLVCFFIAAVPTILRHFHLTQAQTLLLDKIGREVGKLLSLLDSFSFTNTVVTFLFWGVVGIVIYGLTTALVRLWQAGEEEKELASDEYIHPNGFSRTHFWRQVIEKEAYSVAVLMAELIVICALVFWAFPSGLMRVDALLGNFGFTSVALFLLYSVIISGIFCLGLLVLKAWRYRHILFVI